MSRRRQLTLTSKGNKCKQRQQNNKNNNKIAKISIKQKELSIDFMSHLKNFGQDKVNAARNDCEISFSIEI